MPILNLGDWENNPGQATLVLVSVMLFPDSPEQREEYYATIIAEIFATAGQEIIQKHIPAPALFQALLRAPTVEHVRERARKALARGSMAGDILLYGKMLRNHSVKAGVSQAAYLVQEFGKVIELLKTEPKLLIQMPTLGGMQPPKNRQSVWDAWHDYKSVAHLWAAYNLGCHYSPPEQTPAWVTLGSISNLAAFLARAEFFRQFGIQFAEKPEYKEQIWTVPEGVSLPPVAVEEEIPPIPEWMRIVLPTYHAQQRQYRAP